MYSREEIAVAVMKPLCMIVQGIWINLIGFVLYVPTTAWDAKHPLAVMSCNIAYTWVIAASMTVAAFIYYIAHCQVSRMDNYQVTLALDIEYKTMPYKNRKMSRECLLE